MASRQHFARKLADLHLTHVNSAVALLWYYRQTQQFEERTASELANDLHEEGFPKPNVTLLRRGLTKSRFTVRGGREGTFQLDVRRLSKLDEKYGSLLEVKTVQVMDSVIPSEWVAGTRTYLERLAHQINGCYEYGFYDGCAALCRRLMESLIVEIYIAKGKQDEIKRNGVFLSLDPLIAYIRSDTTITLGRNSPKTMIDVKLLGDTAAHDRVYITVKQDIDDVKARFRRLVQDLLVAAGIKN